MAESLFDIFGDNLTRHSVKNVLRQPLSNNENMGKVILSGPIKPMKANEPTKKKGDTKKSFLSNTGKALQSTPARKVFSPKTVNLGSMIYTDDNEETEFKTADIEFTKPSCKYDNFHKDLFDFLPVPEPEILKQFSPPNTPPPTERRHSMELDCSYQDEFFTDDFSNGNFPEEDLGLPDLY